MQKCRICGKTVTYRESVHLRAHEKTDFQHFKKEPFDYADVCHKCYERVFRREKK